MFTHLVNAMLAGMEAVPIPMCYAIIALWIGLDNAGIPAPMEPVLLFAGALATRGHTVLVLAVVSAALGALLFASFAYVVGQRFGGDAIRRTGSHVGLTSSRADHIELWLRKRGMFGVVIAAFCPILRTFSAYIMGVAQVPWRRFVPGMLIAALAYSTLWVMLGWVLGDHYRAPLRYLDSVGLVGFVILGVVVAAVLVAHHFWGRLALRHVALHFHRHHATGEAIAAPAALLASGASVHGFALAGASSARLGLNIAPGALDGSLDGTRSLAQVRASFERLLPTRWSRGGVGGMRTEVGPAVGRVALSERWPDWVGAAITVLVSEIAVFLLILSVAAHIFPAFPLDPGLETQLQQLNGTILARPIKLAGDLQWYAPVAVSYVLIYGTLLVLRQYRALICTLVAGFGTDLFNVVINTFVARPRPHGVAIPTLSGNLGQGSFPSGHVAHTVGLYGFVFFLCILGKRAEPRWKIELTVVQAICVYFILFVGLTRIMEGQHWPSDVIGGYLSGTLTLTVAILLYHLLAMRKVAVREKRAARQLPVAVQ